MNHEYWMVEAHAGPMADYGAPKRVYKLHDTEAGAKAGSQELYRLGYRVWFWELISGKVGS